MNPIPPVSQTLTEMGIPHRVFRHLGPLRSLEQAAEERSQRPNQVVRSILFRLSNDEYVMVLIAGSGQIDWKTLRHYLGVSRLSMASREQVLEVTGYPLGAVTPFGLPHPIRILVDRSVQAESEISLGSGLHSVGIIMQSADLLLALGEVELVELAQKT
jgi:prolyl-tRNA editing enzyme YbaK/EbsC (Cys-tRNA(Pro) deacylase)